MSFNRKKLKQIDELAINAIEKNSAYYKPAIEGYLKAIKNLEDELVDLDDNENLFVAYDNFSFLLKNFLNQYENINFQLIGKSILVLKNFFSYREEVAEKYRSNIQNNISQTIQILKDYCSELEAKGDGEENEIANYHNIIELLKNITTSSSQQNLDLSQKLNKRKSLNLNGGLTERRAIKEAKRESVQDALNSGLKILASVAEEQTQMEGQSKFEVHNTSAEPKPIASDDSLITNWQSSPVSTSSFSLFNNNYLPSLPLGSEKPCYYSKTPRTFDEWYSQLEKRAQDNLCLPIKAYVPQPSPFLFQMFKEEYRKQYGEETRENVETVLNRFPLTR